MKNFGVLILLFVSLSSLADQRKKISICANKPVDKLRLICYDHLAYKLGLYKPEPKVTTGNWKTFKEQSPIDDSINVTLSLSSSKKVYSGHETVQPRLFVRCSENKTNVFLNWGLYLGLNQTDMLTRFDKSKASTDSWNLSTDNEAVFVQGNDISFAKKIMKHEKLLVKITPYNRTPVMATFNISGLAEAIKPLRTSCGW